MFYIKWHNFCRIRLFKRNAVLVTFLVIVQLMFMLGTEGLSYTDRVPIRQKRGGDLKPSEAELQNLPDYCSARIRAGKQPRSTAEARRWFEILGEDFIHMHHYCFALNSLNKIALGIGDRNFLLGEALSNLDYMIEHVRPSFSLLPQIYNQKGIVLSQMGRQQEAAVCFNQALILKKKVGKPSTGKSSHKAD
jgi:hypothetical protein